jgi:hypothetical protein
LEFSEKKYKNARIVVLAAFVVVTLLLVSAWVAIPKIRGYAAYFGHAPIRIDGNDQFVKKNGVVSGSGSESDPFVIEGWDISCKDSTGILMMNTDSHVVLKNITVNGLGHYYFIQNGIELQSLSIRAHPELYGPVLRYRHVPGKDDGWIDRGLRTQGLLTTMRGGRELLLHPPRPKQHRTNKSLRLLRLLHELSAV